jgi:hypothetical protein
MEKSQAVENNIMFTSVMSNVGDTREQAFEETETVRQRTEKILITERNGLIQFIKDKINEVQDRLSIIIAQTDCIEDMLFIVDPKRINI